MATKTKSAVKRVENPVSKLKVVKNPTLEKSIEQMINEQRQQNLIKFVDGYTKLCAETGCRHKAEYRYGEEGASLLLIPVNTK